MNPEPPTCHTCGARLPIGRLEGNCPSCLMRMAFPMAPSDEDTAASASVPSPANPKLLPYFGDYELIEEIDRGGMGAVYRARQRSLNRMVAVKVLLAGQFANETFFKRFRREAEAAASLRHPNIVAIYEVGQQEGQPYFSMELIEGRSLAELTRDNPLPPRQAARYLKSIAEAVHYAHGQGVIHRDLKPSNVVVDTQDVPHITDFGLAKRLEPVPELTLAGQVMGTPSYMPPEQADVKRGKTTPASDVYSLGAMFFHLLTGRAPFLSETIEATLRQVLEQNPVSPRLLNPAVPMDLETICLKCLTKEPERRYATAQALADELGRWLEGKPILSRPASSAEKLWRWCRRNPALSLTGAAGVLAVVLGLAGICWQWRQAETSRQQAQAEAKKAVTEATRSQQVAQLLQNMLKGVGPAAARGRDTAMLKEILEQTLQSMGKDLTNQPAVEADLLTTIGLVYKDLFEFEKAEPLFRKALQLQRQMHTGDNLALAASLYKLGEALMWEHEFSQSKILLREALAMYRNLQATDNVEVANCLLTLGVTETSAGGSLVEAERLFRETIGLQSKLEGQRHKDVAYSSILLALTLVSGGGQAEAEGLAQQALDIARSLPPGDAMAAAYDLQGAALLFQRESKWEEAENLYREAVPLLQKIQGRGHRNFWYAVSNLATVLRNRGRTAEAEALLRQTLEEARNYPDAAPLSLAGGSWDITLQITLADILLSEGKPAEADELLRQTLEAARKAPGVTPASLADLRTTLAHTLISEKKLGEAETLLNEALTPTFAGQPQSTELLTARGNLYARTRRWKEATADFSKALELKSDDHTIYHCLAPLLVQTGDLEGYRRHCSLIRSRFGTITNDPFVSDRMAKDCLILPSTTETIWVDAAVTLGNGKDAEPWFQFSKGLAEYRQQHFAAAADWTRRVLDRRGPTPNRDLEAYMVLAMSQHQLGQTNEARDTMAAGATYAQTNLPRTESEDIGEDWIDWLIAHALMREADALINGATPSPDPAVDQKPWSSQK